MNPTYTWYQALNKPFFAPPSWIFGPVWSVLYVLIAISFGYVFLMSIKGQWSKATAIPFAINLIANFAFTPLQFELQNNILAFIDIIIVFLSIIWMIQIVWNRKRWVAYFQFPYLLWVGFATVLQASITWLNL